MRRNVLVTGAAGFIGRRVVDALKKLDCYVTALNRRHDGAQSQADAQITCDIAQETDFKPVFQNVDDVIHLADGLNALERNENRNLASNLYDANNRFAHQAFQSRIKKFVYVSSVKAMAGEHTQDVLTEKTEPAPASLYGRSKLRLERDLASISKSSTTHLIILRPPVVFGADGGGNFARLLRLANSRWPLPLAGLSGFRSMIHVDVLADALMTTIINETAHSGTYLVHGGRPISVSEIVTILRDEFGKPPRLFVVPGLFELGSIAPLHAQFVRLAGSLVLDDSFFRSQFSWQPPTSIEKSLRQCARDFLQQEKS